MSKTTKKTTRGSRVTTIDTTVEVPAGAKRAAKAKTTPAPGRKKASRDARLPKLGTVLTRTYKGKQITATVVDGGLEYEDEVYKSLSGLARHIVGYQISGPVFFKLTTSPDAEEATS